jgi:single-stranded DNA-binding protein
MNSCNFVGKVVDTPILQEEDGSKVVRFLVCIEEHRRDVSGLKKKMYTTLGFEAWDTGAEAISANCRAGDFIALESHARHDDNTDETFFRVKSFKVFK